MKTKLVRNTPQNNASGIASQIQTILGADGQPAFVVIPYKQFIEEYDRNLTLVPNQVLDYAREQNVSAIRAWREYLGLSQNDIATKLDVTQAAAAQFEVKGHNLRKSTMTKIAKAMGLVLSQINW